MKIELNIPVKDKPITQEWEDDEWFVRIYIPKEQLDGTLTVFEKQIRQKPIHKREGILWYVCPKCERGLWIDWSYCPRCGQALKWEGGATDGDTSTD